MERGAASERKQPAAEISEHDLPNVDTSSTELRGNRLRDTAGLGWVVVFVALIALGSFSWFDQVRYEPPVFGDDEATRAALEDLRVVPLGEELSMASSAPHRWIMGDGFGVPEDDGTWIAAIRSNLFFETEIAPASSVDLYLFPLLSAALTERPVTISTAAGVTEARLTGGGQWVTAPLPRDLAQEVVIKCETVDSPLDLGLGPDQRKLCAKLIAVRLNP